MDFVIQIAKSEGNRKTRRREDLSHWLLEVRHWSRNKHIDGQAVGAWVRGSDYAIIIQAPCNGLLRFWNVEIIVRVKREYAMHRGIIEAEEATNLSKFSAKHKALKIYKARGWVIEQLRGIHMYHSWSTSQDYWNFWRRRFQSHQRHQHLGDGNYEHLELRGHLAYARDSHWGQQLQTWLRQEWIRSRVFSPQEIQLDAQLSERYWPRFEERLGYCCMSNSRQDFQQADTSRSLFNFRSSEQWMMLAHWPSEKCLSMFLCIVFEDGYWRRSALKRSFQDPNSRNQFSRSILESPESSTILTVKSQREVENKGGPSSLPEATLDLSSGVLTSNRSNQQWKS